MTAPPDASVPSGQSRVVLVVGSGRSGTSSVSGTLKYLGLHVPQPEVQANKTNPRGFFEPEWVVDFNNDLMSACGINSSDARPGAVTLAADVMRLEEHREHLRAWLGQALEQGDGLVVKDPRTSWFQDIWRHAAQQHGISLSILTMLRHPAEVSSSRQTHYKSKEAPQARRAGTTLRVAGWVNLNLATELANRDVRRVFVRYADLLGDWRATMREVRERLDPAGLRDTDWPAPHEVDEFLDVGLRRHQVGWEDVDLPEGLRDLAEQVWRQLGVLVTSGGRDAAAEKALDSLREDYAAMYADAEAMARDSAQAAAGQAGPRKGTRSARRRRAARAAAAAEARAAAGSP
ncbi:MAG: sulfotransferase family protein [Actinomycetota bacterium]|nr:sulfotransferase family protein [Actinomycetota bacterium]